MYQPLFREWFSCWGYSVSALEGVAVLAGLTAVVLLALHHWATWPVGMVGLVGFSILFFRAGLYPDAILQLYLIGVSINGWVYWQRSTSGMNLNVHQISRANSVKLIAVLLSGTCISGWIFFHANQWWPSIFPYPAAFPWADSAVMVASLIAIHLQARKCIENWYFWLIADVVSTLVYWQKELPLIAIEYLLFCALALWGWKKWRSLLLN